MVAWYKRSKAPKVEVSQIYVGIRNTLLEYYNTILSKEQAQHAGTRGTSYEKLIQDFLKAQLPKRFYVGSGQVLASEPSSDSEGLIQWLSRQMDVVIFDAFNHPILLPEYELFPIEGTLAVVEVKSKLTKATLLGTSKEQSALVAIESAKRLRSSEDSAPGPIGPNGIIESINLPSPLGIIFAFDSIRPQKLAEYWAEWNVGKEVHYRTDMICLLKKQVIIVDTTRLSHLTDPHQLADPFIRASGPGKLVALKSPAILFFLIVLTLRELRRMASYSERLTSTTPSSYIRDVSISRIFEYENAPNPHFVF